ncbi:hypothetical protein [Halobacteriovorax sp. ZH2_bin.1]|uniref:hypothetical protein n=1 Tax=unclassified Halobacteriovorax TaxID=2639665 RepID=UPI0037213287
MNYSNRKDSNETEIKIVENFLKKDNVSDIDKLQAELILIDLKRSSERMQEKLIDSKKEDEFKDVMSAIGICATVLMAITMVYYLFSWSAESTGPFDSFLRNCFTN